MSLRRQTTPERFESERFFDFKNKAGKPLSDFLEPEIALMLYGYVSYFDDAWQELKDVCEDEHNFDKMFDFTARILRRTDSIELSSELKMDLIGWKHDL